MKKALLSTVFFSVTLLGTECPQGVEILDAYGLVFAKNQLLAAHKCMAPSIRIESFGDMQVTIHAQARSAKRTAIIVEGPLPSPEAGKAGDAPQVVKFEVSPSKMSHVRLGKKGIYRLYSEQGKTVELAVHCLKNCSREKVTLPNLLIQAKKNHTLPLVNAYVSKVVSDKISDEAVRQQIFDELNKVSASTEEQIMTQWKRFPILPPLPSLSGLRPWMEETHHEPVKSELVEEVALLDWLQKAVVKKEAAPIHPMLPHVRYGHFPKNTLTEKQQRHSIRLAELLNGLAAGSVQSVRYDGREILDAAGLMEELLRTGHVVDIQKRKNARQFSLAHGRTIRRSDPQLVKFWNKDSGN